MICPEHIPIAEQAVYEYARRLLDGQGSGQDCSHIPQPAQETNQRITPERS